VKSKPLLLSITWALLLSHSAHSAKSQTYKIYLTEPGVYQVRYADLASVDLNEVIKTAKLTLHNQGYPVPLWVEDGGDGEFGPGDKLEFIGEALRGEVSYYNEYSPLNVYLLSWGDLTPSALRKSVDTPLVKQQATASQYFAKDHFEEDLLRIPLSSSSRESLPQELWYWSKLSHIAPAPFRHTLDLTELDTDSEYPLTLRLHFRGWSDPFGKPTLPDHQVDVFFNDTLIGSGEWNGRETYLLNLPRVPTESVQPGENALTIQVPSRTPEDRQEPLIDVIYLDWIEIDFPRKSGIYQKQTRLMLGTQETAAAFQLETELGRALTIYGEQGNRVIADIQQQVGGDRLLHRFPLPAGEQLVWVVRDGELKTPLGIEQAQQFQLTKRRQQVDYFMIAHPRLIDAVEPLAAFHRQRGLKVEVINVRDIYDEFNHGILHPRAISDFLVHAQRYRTSPAPRFVLLVGDADWYTKNNTDWRGTEKVLNHRNLIPTWHYLAVDGPAASDNAFVTIVGDDHHPDMALGRFPVTEPREVSDIVNKTIRYMQVPEPGPWRRRVLLISDQTQQTRSDKLIANLANTGLKARKLMPLAAEGKRHQAKVRQALDQGQFLVHFYGHGSRYAWQTISSRTPSIKSLFDLDELKQLRPSARLPIVLSMTCDSAPFDHPSADSLGEKFLRLSDRGAVAILAASARNAPLMRFSEALFTEIVQAEFLGEAIVQAKRALKSNQIAALYNLFGDPALLLEIPQSEQ
jgi:hypothetical protein